MKLVFSIVFLAIFLCASCSDKNKNQEVPPKNISTVSLEERAVQLSQELIIVDGHVDLPYRLRSNPEDVSVQTEKGHFDYVRAKQGGLDAPFMSIYIPAAREMNGAMELALELITSVEQLCEQHPDKFALAKSPSEIQANFSQGLISFPMGLENGAPIEGSLENLEMLYEKGIRYITLCHSKDNHICDSSYDQRYTHGGLSPFGYEVVEKMNQLGIMIDVSHVSDSAFYQAIRASRAPVIASHSSCRHFTPGFERNVSDDMIRLIGENNGIMMINFGSAFITSKGSEAMRQVLSKVTNGEANESDPEIQAALDSIREQPALMGNIALVADHIDRVVDIAGIDHVGFGSDFDGVSNLPIGLEDASKLPDLIRELLKRGYTDEDIAKICYQNIFRVWNTVIEIASDGQQV
jgi:membrane dipeptidase